MNAPTSVLRRLSARLGGSTPSSSVVDPDDPAIVALRTTLREMHEDLTLRLAALAERIDQLERLVSDTKRS